MTTTFENCTDASTVTIPRADLDAAIEALEQLFKCQSMTCLPCCENIGHTLAKLKGLQ